MCDDAEEKSKCPCEGTRGDASDESKCKWCVDRQETIYQQIERAKKEEGEPPQHLMLIDFCLVLVELNASQRSRSWTQPIPQQLASQPPQSIPCLNLWKQYDFATFTAALIWCHHTVFDSLYGSHETSYMVAAWHSSVTYVGQYCTHENLQLSYDRETCIHVSDTQCYWTRKGASPRHQRLVSSFQPDSCRHRKLPELGERQEDA